MYKILLKICFLILCSPLLLQGELFTQSLDVEKSKLTYYLERPDTNRTYPILLFIEGSYSEETGPTSVFRLHGKVTPPILKQEMAVITLERRGSTKEEIDEKIYHEENFPSRRLADHIQLITHLREHPPENWNGKLIIAGGSEGAPIAIKVALATSADGCIVIVGMGDLSFQEYVWKTIQAKQKLEPNPDFPQNYDDYKSLCSELKDDPDPTKWWYGQTYLYWSDALNQTAYEEFLSLKCPILLFTGNQDIACKANDRIVELAKEQGQDVTYVRNRGMGHEVFSPEWHFFDHVITFSKRVFDITYE